MTPIATAILILVAVIAAFAWQKLPASVVAMAGAMAMMFAGILQPEEVFSGLGGETVLTVLFMMILGEVIFRTGLASVIGKVLSKSGQASETALLIILIIITALLSAFLSNTATVAMLMALVGSMSSSGMLRIRKKSAFMAIGISATVGGLGTLVGSVVQVPVNNYLREQTGQSLGFFSLIPIWAVLVLVMVGYYWLWGSKAQNRRFAESNDLDGQYDFEKPVNPTFDRRKMVIALVSLVLCVVSFATDIVPLYIAAALASCICIVFGCISEKDAFKSVNLNVLIILACLVALANGMNNSGAGEYIANALLGVVGTESPLLVFAVIVGICTLLTNMMSNPVVAMLIIPIALNMAETVGINPTTMAVGVIVGSTLAFASPIGSPPVTMTMVAGYNFNDYVKLGGPLCLLSYIATVIFVPLIYGL